MARGEKRSAARLAAVQALYQMDLSGKGLMEAVAEFETFWLGREVEGISFKPAEEAFFRDIMSGVVREQVGIDRAVDDVLKEGWPLTRIDTVLRAILRAAVYEMSFRKDIPPKVIISEYIEVAHAFYSGEEPRMVNGVLDKIGRRVRADELNARA